MSIDEKKKNEIEWYDNPNVVTSLIIGLIALIVILSQSFAINNNLGVMELLSSILNHNISYLLVCVYFVALKTKIGKQYFDFLNVFMIILHALTAITSLLSVFQSFGLGSLLVFAIDWLILIYLFHTFLRSTRVWKSMNLCKSPFNEISNSGYFNAIIVLAVTLLAVNLISTTSFDGTLLTLMDTAYTFLFVRYIFLYGVFLDSKKISVNNSGNFNEVREMITDSVDNFVEKHDIDEKFDNAKEKVTEFVDDVAEKVSDVKEEVQEKIDSAKLDEKFEAAKDRVEEFTDSVKDRVSDFKEDVEEKIKETKIDDKIFEVKDMVVELANDAKEEINRIKVDKKKAVLNKKEGIVNSDSKHKTNKSNGNKKKFNKSKTEKGNK